MTRLKEKLSYDVPMLARLIVERPKTWKRDPDEAFPAFLEVHAFPQKTFVHTPWALIQLSRSDEKVIIELITEKKGPRNTLRRHTCFQTSGPSTCTSDPSYPCPDLIYLGSRRKRPRVRIDDGIMPRKNRQAAKLDLAT
jgi:hypothetical protein